MSKWSEMIVIDNILVSDDIVEKQFVCDLAKCKGGCCEDGDAGAPLENEELDIILELYEKVKPYLSPQAIAHIERKGKYVYSKEFGWVTPTLPSDHEICVYGFREKDGTIKCAFEQACSDGVTNWKKPISCHLYPIVTKQGKHGDYQRVNYSPREKLCKPACSLGKQLKVPAYKFLKEPLVRKFGTTFYDTLDAVAKECFETNEK